MDGPSPTKLKTGLKAFDTDNCVITRHILTSHKHHTRVTRRFLSSVNM